MALIVFALCSSLCTALAQNKPNVLLICVDDLKPVLACYGDAIVKTPNIDRLAKRGVLFERAYCNQAVCAPSRNALMTGLRPTTLGIYDLGTFFRTSAPEAVTLPQSFRKAGYSTEALGKIFHVGHGNHEDADSWTVPHWRPQGPMYVIQSNLPAAERKDASANQPDPAKKKKKKQNGATANTGSNPQLDVRTVAARGAAVECADVPDTTYADGQIADEAVRRLKAAKEKNGPFFLAVGFLKPHLPFVAPKKYWDLYKRGQFQPHPNQRPPAGAPEFAPTTWGELRNYSDIPDTGPLSAAQQQELIHGYYAAISYTDAQIGRVLDELDRLGLEDKTVVVLWGDHGWHLGDHGMWCKHTNYEQAARIPVIVAAPGVGARSAKAAALIETVDLYPTICELAQVTPSSKLDGASFAATLKDPAQPTKKAVFHVFPRNVQGKGQLIGRAVRTDRYRLVEWKLPNEKPETAILELYDYKQDPGETKNLANENPEAVKELRALLASQPEARPQVTAAAN